MRHSMSYVFYSIELRVLWANLTMLAFFLEDVKVTRDWSSNET